MKSHFILKLDLDSLNGCIFNDRLHAQSLLQVSEICKELLVLGVPEALDVTLLDPVTETEIELADVAMNKRPRTLRDWADAELSLFSFESSLCPNCGHSAFVEPVLFCDACGANPGRVHEEVQHV